MSRTVTLRCPTCAQALAVHPDHAGRTVRCQRCDTAFRPVDLLDKEEPLPALPVDEPAPAPSVASQPSAQSSANPADERDPSDDQATIVMPRRSPYKPLVERLGAGEARRRNTTTMLELSGVAEQFVGRARRQIRVGVALAVVATVFPLLVLATALIPSPWRWLPGSLAAICACALLGWGALRALPVAARRIGPRVLPGRAAWWLAGGGGVLATMAVLLTWGASSATTPLVIARRPAPPEKEIQAEPRRDLPPDAAVPDTHVKAGAGVLYVPTSFHTDDGSFDLLLHFHGNTRLVEESCNEARLNALVHVTNLGTNSRAYERHFAVPAAFPKLLDSIEQEAAELGLANARIRRIAISSWSAGYGAVQRIIQLDGTAERLDALMMLDGLHLGYVDESQQTVDERHLAPFVRFAEAAAAGDKLFILTHSEVRTHGYASARETAQILLGQLGVTAVPVDSAERSPPRVDFEEARKAVPQSFDQWLEATTVAHRGSFHVWGYAGRTPEHHMAHLVQMAVTVLPELVERWTTPPPPPPTPDGAPPPPG